MNEMEKRAFETLVRELDDKLKSAYAKIQRLENAGCSLSCMVHNTARGAIVDRTRSDALVDNWDKARG